MITSGMPNSDDIKHNFHTKKPKKYGSTRTHKVVSRENDEQLMITVKSNGTVLVDSEFNIGPFDESDDIGVYKEERLVAKIIFPPEGKIRVEGVGDFSAVSIFESPAVEQLKEVATASRHRITDVFILSKVRAMA